MLRRLKAARDAFPQSADEYNQPAERLLQLKRADMDAVWGNIEEGWAANNERMARFGLTPRTDDLGLVKLNVGGLNVTVCWHLLAEAEGFKDSILGALLEGDWGKGRILRDADGRIMLDESPTCIKHIIAQTKLRANGGTGSVAVGLPASVAHSAVATIDEAPCLIYTAHLLGLPGYVATHPKYVNMNGGNTTILEPLEIAPFGAKLREWVGDSTEEMTLIYRATRDGFGREAFAARCNTSSPQTVSLIRVSSGQGNSNDSVVGGYSTTSWSSLAGTKQRIASSDFVFMLKDGSATRTELSKPIMGNPKGACVNRYFEVPQIDGPYVGVGNLVTMVDKESGRYTMRINQDRPFFPISSSPPFLALHGKEVVEIEVYRYSAPAAPATTTPSTTKVGGDTLTDAKARDIDSFGWSIATSLMEERVILDRAEKGTEAASARISAAVGALETVYGPSVAAGEQDAVVELNVRGTRMTTLLSTLQACPRSALATMFDEERWPATDKDKDEHGRRLIDCNPTCFSKILDVLRMRKRASWGLGVEGVKQEEEEEKEGKEKEEKEKEEKEESSAVLPGGVLIKETDKEAFGEAVNMYFPGCESFIMDLVQPV